MPRRSSAPNHNERFIGQFLEMMLAERGASANTIAAYRRDLRDFLVFLKAEPLTGVSRRRIEAFLSGLSQSGMEARTVARKLSCLRQFFQFFYSERLRADNPAATLEMPKLGRHLPHTLTTQDVDALLSAARGADTPAALRTLAMLELMYGAGLRVSEMVSLKLSSLQVKEGSKLISADMLLIRGKGGKERMVPLGNHARTALSKYLQMRHVLYR